MNTANSESIGQRRSVPSIGVRVEHLLAAKTCFTARERMRLYDRLYRFVHRGYGLKIALEGMLSRFETKNDPRRIIWRRWVRGLNEGQQFAQLAAPYIPIAEQIMLAAGDRSGKLDVGFRTASFVADAARKMKNALVAALTYPVILLAALVGVLVFVAVKLMPALEGIYPVEKWPSISRGLYHIANFLRDYGVFVALGAVALAIVVVYSLPRWQTAWRRRFDKRVPVYTMYREFQGASLLIALSALLQSGTPIETALTDIRKNASPWLGWHIDLMMKLLRGKGLRPSEAIDTGLLHDETIGYLQDYDRAGSFADAIEAVGRDIVDDAVERLRRLAAILGVVFMGTTALMMIWTFASFIFVVMELQKNSQMSPFG